MERGLLVMDAIASGLDAGLSPPDCLSTIARASPGMARLARQLEDHARGASLASAVATVLVLAEDERRVITIGDEAGKLAAAMRWVIARREARRARRSTIVSVAIAPLLIGVVTLLLEPLPGVVMGTGSFMPVIRGLGLAAFLIVIVAMVLRRLPPRLTARVPFIGSLTRLARDLDAAALVSTFADGDSLGASSSAVRAIVDDERANALDRAAAEPSSTLAGVSESLGLVLTVGQRVGDLSARARSFETAASARLSSRLRGVARVLAWSFALAASIHATRLVLQLQLPSLGGDLNVPDSPELKELMKELDNAGK